MMRVTYAESYSLVVLSLEECLPRWLVAWAADVGGFAGCCD